MSQSKIYWDSTITNFDPTPTGDPKYTFDGYMHSIPDNHIDKKMHIASGRCWCMPEWKGFDDKTGVGTYLHRMIQ